MGESSNEAGYLIEWLFGKRRYADVFGGVADHQQEEGFFVGRAI